MRDYANKNRRSSSAPRRPGLLALSIFLLILAFSLPFVLIYQHHKMMSTQKELSQHKNELHSATVSKPKDPSQEFDFYTLLPKMAVPNNLPTDKKSTAG